MPLFIDVDVVVNCGKNVQKDKCQLLVELLATGYVAIPSQVPGHP